MIPIRLIFLAVLLAPVAGHAQSREPFESEPAGPLLRGDVAGSRQPAGMEPLGVHAGPLLVRPSITARVGADSNVLNRTSEKRGDVFVVLATAVSASGETGRASYVLRAEAAAARFASERSQNSETFGAEANGRLAVADRGSVFARVSFDRKVEPPGSAGAAAIEGSPARLDQLEAQLAVRADPGPFRITASATATRLEYAGITTADDTVVDQGFRDSEALTLGLKAEYSAPFGITMFIDGNYRWLDNLHPAANLDHSSNGGQVRIGMRGDITSLVTAQAAIGYVFADYDSPVFRDFGGLTWQARLEWYPTPLISVALASGRSLVNSGIPEVASVIVDTTSLQLHYEVRRNLDLVATLSRTNEDFRGSDARVHSTLIGLEGRYVLGPATSAGLYARLRLRNASGSSIPRGGGGMEGGMSLRLAL